MKKGHKKRIIVILGMHRSGTSAIARGLLALGVDLGTNLIPPVERNNEKGFWEDVDISNLDNELLRFLGHDWCTLKSIQPAELERSDIASFRLRAVELLRGKLKNKTVFGMKDPRFARLLPFWENIFKKLNVEVSYIIAVRHPLSVADSLNKRDGFEREKSSYLWLGHVVPSMLDSEGYPRVVVDFDLLLAQPEKQLHRIAKALNLPFDFSAPGIGTYVKEFLANDLCHTKFCMKDLKSAPDVPREVVDAYVLLNKLARDRVSVSSKEVHISFAQLNKGLDEIQPAFDYITKTDAQIACLNKTIAKRETEIAALHGVIAERDALIEAIKSSRSWKITKPLRILGAAVEIPKQQEEAAQEKELKLQPAIFMHIQKTAGTTLVDFARSAYGTGNMISHGDYLKGIHHFPLKGEFWMNKQILETYHNIPFLSGHFGYDFLKRYMKDRYSFTFLRDPVERILSFYFFCKNQDPTLYEIFKRCQRTKLNDFLKMGLVNPKIKYFIWNNQVWQLACGFGNWENRDISSFRPKELLELAILHLDDFSYIGFTETFENDRDHILKTLGIPAPNEKIVLNANPGRQMFHDMPQSTKTLLLELTELDRILYQEACSRHFVQRDKL